VNNSLCNASRWQNLPEAAHLPPCGECGRDRRYRTLAIIAIAAEIAIGGM